MAIADFLIQTKKAFRQIGIGRLAKGVVTLVVILGVGFFAKSIDFEGVANWINFDASTGANWYQGKSGFFIVGALFTAIGGPRQIIAFFAAYFFGIWSGLFISTLATGFGCLMAACFARLFEPQIRQIIRGHIDVAFDYWRKHPVSTTIIIRLLPVGSNLFTNLAAGAGKIPLLTFVAASTLGYVPQMAVFGLMGSGVDVGEGWQIGLGIALFVVSTVIGLWVYGRYRRQIRRKKKSR